MNRLDRIKCDICGEVITSFGHLKLSDGNICTECAKLISPLLKNRKSADVIYMRNHIEYRKDNEKRLKNFKPEIRYGYGKKIYIDPNQFAFLVTNKLEKDIASGNPDIISFSQVKSVETFARQHRDRTNNTDVYYDFTIVIKLDSEWYDEVSVKLNADSIKGKENRLYYKCCSDAKQLKDMLMPDKSFKASLSDVHPRGIFRL